MDACRSNSGWGDRSDCVEVKEAWNHFAEREGNSPDKMQKPVASYGKRSSRLAELRLLVDWARTRSEADSSLPTKEAVASAKNFINGLAEGVFSHHIRLAVSSGGEINFFFESNSGLFQTIILEDGKLSFYAQTGQEEIMGSDSESGDFPHLRLLTFLSSRQR